MTQRPLPARLSRALCAALALFAGRRDGVPTCERAYAPTIIDAATLATAPQRRLDEALRAVPGFGLFRRSGSRIANPTAQGVSLRGSCRLYRLRLPTLNELYRLFRVGNDITEANPALVPERLRGVEGAAPAPQQRRHPERQPVPCPPENAVDNVVIQTTTGTNAELGVFVPAGGSLAQRRCLDRVTVRGLEADIAWQATESLRLSAAYLFSDSEITDPGSMMVLKGNQLGQSPRHSGTLDITWNPLPALTLRTQVRAAGKQAATA